MQHILVSGNKGQQMLKLSQATGLPNPNIEMNVSPSKHLTEGEEQSRQCKGREGVILFFQS